MNNWLRINTILHSETETFTWNTDTFSFFFKFYITHVIVYIYFITIYVSRTWNLFACKKRSPSSFMLVCELYALVYGCVYICILIFIYIHGQKVNVLASSSTSLLLYLFNVLRCTYQFCINFCVWRQLLSNKCYETVVKLLFLKCFQTVISSFQQLDSECAKCTGTHLYRSKENGSISKDLYTFYGVFLI